MVWGAARATTCCPTATARRTIRLVYVRPRTVLAYTLCTLTPQVLLSNICVRQAPSRREWKEGMWEDMLATARPLRILADPDGSSYLYSSDGVRSVDTISIGLSVIFILWVWHYDSFCVVRRSYFSNVSVLHRIRLRTTLPSLRFRFFQRWPETLSFLLDRQKSHPQIVLVDYGTYSA